MNKKKYDALPEQAKQIIREFAKEALVWQRQITKELKEKCEAEINKNWNKNLSAFRSREKEVYRRDKSCLGSV